MTVTKVVGFDLRIPRHFSFHFSDFSMILYGIYKFVVFENKRKRKRTFASRPLDFCFFSREVLGGGNRTGEVLGGGNRTGEGLRRRFPRGSAPAARGKLGKRVRGLVRTCRWSQLGLRWPVVACPRAPAAGGGPVPRRRCSSEGTGARRGRRAPLEGVEAVGRVGS